MDFDRATRRITPRSPLSQETFEWIKEGIVTGHFQPGERIREIEIAEHLGISRTPIREAFVRLTEFGLGSYEPNRGFRVVSVSLGQIRNVGEVRVALETLAVRLCAQKATRQQLVEIEALVNKAKHRVDADHTQYPLDLNFHRTLLESADNPTLTDMLARINATVRTVRTWSGMSWPRPMEAVLEHGNICATLLEGDANAAVQAMADHIEASTATMLSSVETDSTLSLQSGSDAKRDQI